MRVSVVGIMLIKEFESFRAKAYKCPAGVWTVGYGTTKGVHEGMQVTELQATEMLKQHIEGIEEHLNRLNLGLNQNQFDALASFIYNVGTGAFDSSNLLKTIRRNRSIGSISDEFRRWVYSKGVVLPGLVKRREKEANLYFA